MRRPSSRFALFPLLATLALALPAHARSAQEFDPYAETLVLSSDLRIRLHHGRQIELEVRAPEEEDALVQIAARVCGDPGRGPLVGAWNGGRPPAAGDWVRVPLELLDPDHRRLVLMNLFPDDRVDEDAWVHRARVGALATYDEGLWQVAGWFTGDGARWEELMLANGLSSPELRRGQEVRIPLTMLTPGMRPGARSADGRLEYAHDREGPFAAYYLAPGEALYTAVVLRFTGRETASDVNAVAEQIAARSGIPDLRDIPVGYRIKIPLDLLEPQYLPENHPRRLAAETARAELEQELRRQPVERGGSGLEGVWIVLDPGHGGKDIGTSNNGVWEHDYVYDVACRFKRLMETRTAARVLLTVEDAQTGCEPEEKDKLWQNLQGKYRLSAVGPIERSGWSSRRFCSSFSCDCTPFPPRLRRTNAITPTSASASRPATGYISMSGITSRPACSCLPPAYALYSVISRSCFASRRLSPRVQRCSSSTRHAGET